MVWGLRAFVFWKYCFLPKRHVMLNVHLRFLLLKASTVWDFRLGFIYFRRILIAKLEHHKVFCFRALLMTSSGKRPSSVSLPFKRQPSRWGREKLRHRSPKWTCLLCANPAQTHTFFPVPFIRSHTSHISLSLCLTGWLKVVLPFIFSGINLVEFASSAVACSSHLTFCWSLYATWACRLPR